MASSISRPQSSAAPRSPLSAAGYTSPIKYASYAPNQLHSDPNAVFASESRKFLSSRKGERPYPSESDQQRQRSGSYSATSGATTDYHRGLPPPLPERMYNGSRTPQQLLAAEIGRSNTAIPRHAHDPTSPKGLYPSHMLPPKHQSTIGPFSTYRDPPSSIEDPYASHRDRYRSPLHSPTPSSVTSATNSTSSPPSSQPQSPTRPLHHVSSQHHHQQHYVHGHSSSHSSSHAHGRTHSLATNAYATDYAGSGSKLLPTTRGVPSKRHTQGYPTSHSNGYSNGNSLGLGAVGPALAHNIPPVLPRPPSVKGTSASGLRRSDSLGGRNGTVRKGEKTITDEEQAAYAALNTYR